MKAERPNPEPEQETDSARSNRALREEIEQLRAEVAYLKKLEALVRANRQAARKERKP
jgi:transposase